MDTNERLNRTAFLLFLNSRKNREVVEKLIDYDSFVERVESKDNYFLEYYNKAVIELREEKINKILNGNKR